MGLNLKDALIKAGLTAAGIAAGAIPGGGVAKELIASALDLDVNSSEEKVAESLAIASPEQLVKLQEVNNKHKERFEEIGLERDKVEMQDRQGARDMRTKLGGDDVNIRILAFLPICGVLLFSGFLFFIDLPMGVQTTLALLIGVLVTVTQQVYGFFFGSSDGSKAKQGMLDRLISSKNTGDGEHQNG